MKKVLALSYNDFKNVAREPMVLMMIIGPILFSIFIRYFVPYLAKTFSGYFDLPPYYDLISSYILLMGPLLMGMVTGFLLLDERDEHTWIGVIVTPLGKKNYIFYKTLMPTLISFIYIMITVKLGSLVQTSLIHIIPIAIMAALEAPIIALYLCIFAGNKVEGLALSKSLGIFMLAPLLQYFTASKWAMVAWAVPFYWPVQAFLTVHHGLPQYWLNLGLGIIIHGVLLTILVVLFDKKIN